MNYKERAAELLNETINRRRELHRIAEVGLFLPKTAEYVIKELESLGLTYKRYKNSDGIIAVIDSGKPGKIVALRADMDALPVVEETGAPYACDTGCMHACGHDAHTAMLLTAARMLCESRDELCGKVKLIFQPGEELNIGASTMAAEGALNEPKADATFGQHVGCLYDAPAGTVCIRGGAMMSAQNMIKFTVTGKGSHGAEPQNSIDPIVTAADIITSIQSVISREVSPFDNTVFSICSIHGGSSYNVIPPEVTMQATMRTYSEEFRQFLLKRIGEVSSMVARAHRAECRMDIVTNDIATFNNDNAADFISSIAARLYGENAVTIMKNPTMVSEDVCVFLNDAPGAFWLLSTKPAENAYKNHNPKFEIEESVLDRGAALLAEAAAAYLRENREF